MVGGGEPPTINEYSIVCSLFTNTVDMEVGMVAL